ncbi:MAG: tetratricopeptide repeat protein, partial [Marinoscillum sp.]
MQESDSNYQKVQLQLLSTFNAAEQYDQTVLKAKELLEKPSSNQAQVMLSYGYAWLNSDRLDSARAVYLNGLDEFPYHHVFLYNLGITYYKEADYQKAKEYFLRCLKINPFYSSAHLMLGYISILEGNRTKSLMSYMTCLMITPQNKGVLVTLENLVNDGVRIEGKESAGDQVFEYYDNLLKSKAALDDRFKYKVKFNASIVKQTELLFSKLRSSGEDDFWVKHYLPLFMKLRANELVEVTLYKVLQSANSEDVSAWLNKNSSLSDEWVDVVNSELQKWRAYQKVTLSGAEDTYKFWYFDDNSINAIGNENDAGEKIGPWIFFYDNSEVSALGAYNQAGEKIGNWEYYHDNGVLSRQEKYDDQGNIIEPAVYYRSDGSVATIVPYEGQSVEGLVRYFYECDQVKEEVTYVDSKSSGEGTFYYASGAKKIDYSMKDGELEGDYTMYHQTGNVSNRYFFKEGKKEGPYKIIYNNGQVEEEGNYQNDVTHGKCTGYFASGTLAYEGEFVEGNKVGSWKYYYDNGNLRLEEHYDEEGEYHGDLTAYNKNGFKEYVNVYDHAKIVSYEYYDDSGQVLSSASSPDGNMVFEKWRWNGTLYSKGQLVGGKLNGDYTIFHENGKVFQQGTMKDNDWHGPFKEYFSSGKVSFIGSYQDGLEEGYFAHYNKIGQKEREGHYVAGMREQQWKSYYQNGQLEEDSYAVAGASQGWLVTYAEDGKVWSKMKYDQDKVTEYILYDTAGNEFMHKELPFSTGEFNYLYPNGKTNFSTDMGCGYFQDSYKHYYPDGKLLSDRSMVNGVYDGAYRKYAHDGSILIEGAYDNNLETGQWNYYSPDGTLERTYHYLEGDLHGVYVRYYENGQPEMKITYYLGDREGPSYYYDTQGNLQMIKHYDADFGLVAYQYEGSDGELVDKIKFTGKDDRLEAFFANGQPSVVQQYKNGVLDGVTRYYASDGALLEEGTFVEGDYQGDYIRYYSDGQVRSKATYLNDELMGNAYSYYPNGKLKWVRAYLFDAQNGWERIYDKSGKEVEAWYY